MKLSDAEFWAILSENGGLYARTAKAVKKKYGITIGRSSVKERAERQPERLKQIEESNKDAAEAVIIGALYSKDERLRVETAKFYLRTKGKDRGYIERNELTSANGKDIIPSIQVEVIDRREQVDTDEDTND